MKRKRMNTFFGGAVWAGQVHCQMVLQLQPDLEMPGHVLLAEQSEQGWAEGLNGHPWVGSHHQSSSCRLCQQPLFCISFLFVLFIFYLIVWNAKPVVTHQTSWLESTGVCGVRKTIISNQPFDAET